MASDVDICNMALGYLGDDATVASLNPPEGSAQADHCARFYPIARNTLLEMHNWGFATQRIPLTLLSNIPTSPWTYAYAQPNLAVNLLEILAPDATDDYSEGLIPYGNVTGVSGNATGIYTPQDFSTETDPNGNDIILTNQANAVLRCTVLITDPTKFTPLFTESLAMLLASKLAGPVLKGDTGIKAAMAWLNQFNTWFAKATESDANQQRHEVAQRTDWIVNR